MPCIMPPMPPPLNGLSFFSNSASMASVVIIRPAIDAAFCTSDGMRGPVSFAIRGAPSMAAIPVSITVLTKEPA